METFDIIYPSKQLAHLIKHYWFLRIDNDKVVKERTIPIGCMQLVFHRGKQLYSFYGNTFQPKSFLSGQSMNYDDVLTSGSVDMIVVVFQPYGAKAFFSIPMDEFRGKDVSVSDINDPILLELEERLLSIIDNGMCVQLIETYLLSRLYSFEEYKFNRVSNAIRLVNNQTIVTVPQLSSIACLSDKQFNRVFKEYVGMSPKEFARIVRLQRALFLLQKSPNENLAQLAYHCGFYDQSHLIKEFKLFSGYTPTEYLAVCAPYSDYFSVPEL